MKHERKWGHMGGNAGVCGTGHARLHADGSRLLRRATLPSRSRCKALPLTLSQQPPTSLIKFRRKYENDLVDYASRHGYPSVFLIERVSTCWAAAYAPLARAVILPRAERVVSKS